MKSEGFNLDEGNLGMRVSILKSLTRQGWHNMAQGNLGMRVSILKSLTKLRDKAGTILQGVGHFHFRASL